MRSIAILLSLITAASAAPTIQRAADAVSIDLGNGVKLSFALSGDRLLGLRTATIGQTSLKSPRTVVRPFILQEHGKHPVAWDDIRLIDAKADGQLVRLSCNLLATDALATSKRLFVYRGDAVHTDYYLFPMTILPSEVVKLEALSTSQRESPPMPSGKLTWVIEPVTMNVAGWLWHGWKHHYEFVLADGKKVNCLRELSTWELNGQAVGNTLINMRYRGLGGIEAILQPLEGAKSAPEAIPVRNAFTTTEIIPGAVDKAPVVSPAVPGPQNIASRDEAMKYRHGAWIAQLQRGGGVNWVDFQYRPEVALAAWYDRMAAVRSLTEIWPGDTQISQTDALYFPLTEKQATTPKYHLALATHHPSPITHYWRTRWQEMDQFVRDRISRELGFIQHHPLPSVGINIDSGWEFRLTQLIKQVDSFQAEGVKRVLVHHPGWLNGRGLRQKETPYPIPERLLPPPPPKQGAPAASGPVMQLDAGGDCSMHDYIPQSPKVEQLWKDLTRKLNAADIEYWVWITGMVYGTGPVVQKFGEARFCRNSPDVDFSSGYPGANGRAGHRGISMRDAEIRAWWNGRMDAAAKDLGVNGFWADSFQNMYMSQMNYQQADWAPQVREWWEWIAAASRNGVGFMSESAAFPGLSCSIEVGGNPDDFEGTWWSLPYTTRWYRGSPVPNKGTEKADRLYFRSMANKGPICPGDGNVSQVPRYRELSAQYMAALPHMRRPYQLADDAGVLWLKQQTDEEGVLFAFKEQSVPEGVVASAILSPTERTAAIAAHTTCVVRSPDLLKAFSLSRPPEKDPRLAEQYQQPARHIRKW